MIPPIEHKTYIQAPAAQIYRLLTSGAGWDAWFTQGTTVDLRPGGKIHFRWANWGPDHVTTQDEGTVLEAIPNRRFVFTWRPGDTPTTVLIDLEERDGGTVVSLSESGYTSFNGFVECATGWGEALTLLKFYLEHGFTYGPVP